MIIQIAETVRIRYRFEIDGCINQNEFFKAKLKNDRETAKKICFNLYKKVN